MHLTPLVRLLLIHFLNVFLPAFHTFKNYVWLICHLPIFLLFSFASISFSLCFTLKMSGTAISSAGCENVLL